MSENLAEQIIEEKISSSKKPIMSIQIQQKSLVKSLSYVQNIVEKKNIIPILANVKFERFDSISMIASATDMDIEISEKVNVESIKTDENFQISGFTTPAHTFYEIVKKIPSDALISLDLQENQMLKISAGNCHFSLPTLPVRDFPKMDYGQLDISFSMPAATLSKMLDIVRFSICHEETRYNLNGVFFHAEDGNFKAAATDGHRLTSIWTKLPKNANQMPNLILPKKTVFELKKIIDDLSNSENIEISTSTSKITFKIGNVLLASKVIDAVFPDYSKHIPQHNDKNVETSLTNFSQALDRVSIVSFEKNKGIRLSFTENELNLFSVNSTSPEDGNEVVKISSDITEKIEIGFNARYLLEILSTFNKGNIRISLSDKISPMTLFQDSEEDFSFIHVIMPIRV